MKVKAKNLLFGSLPSVRQKKKLMKAQSGKQMGETGRAPISLQTLPDDYFDNLRDILPSQPKPVDLTPKPDTSRIPLPPVPISPPGMPQPDRPPLRKENINPFQALVAGMGAFDAALPDWYPKQQVVQPQVGYNPNLYGTGSQAIAEYGGYIQDDGNNPSAQSGRRIPIFTDNPNDPRIQRYQDSTDLYNLYRKQASLFGEGRNIPNYLDYELKEAAQMGESARAVQKKLRPQGYSALTAAFGDDPLTQRDQERYERRIGQPVQQGAPMRRGDVELVNSNTNPNIFFPQRHSADIYHKTIKPSGYYTETVEDGVVNHRYAEPVQPIVYAPPITERSVPKNAALPKAIPSRPDPIFPDHQSTEVRRTDMTSDIGVRGTGLRPADLSQKPTKYSVTVRDENAPGKQRSIYFKDKKSWKDFMDTGAVSAASSEEREGSATAAGYRTMREGGWIQKAINPAHKGFCTPLSKSTCTPKRKALAKTLKKLAKKRKHEGGGIIPDNMSPFYPARYEQGGNVNGGADVRTVGANYPNTDLLEQWLLYKQGGSVNGDAHIREVGPNYPNADLLEQWLLYKQGGQVNWNGTEFREVGARYPNTDLLEQLIQYRGGGPVNSTGYLDSAPTAQNPYNVIPTGDISMQGVSQPINAIPLRGGAPMAGPMTMMPGQDYSFDADSVLEYPMRAGGQLSSAKAKEMLKDGTANGKKLTAKQKRYFNMVAAGKAQTGMAVSNPTTGAPQVSAQERYYQASAKLGHYKGILNEKLKAKNPQGFTDYFGALTPLRRSGKTAEAQKYVQEAPYEDYLTPQEVQSTLSPDDYNEYLSSLQDVNTYNVQQGQQPLFGTKEGESDIRNLNYGRRFASLQLTPSVGVSNTEGTKKYNRQYNYDPRARQVSFTESGDQSLRPSYLNPATPPMASTASLRKGGVIYDDGGEIGTMWGGNSELASYNPYDGGMVEFQGASHDNGGIGMHYNGQPVEVEGGEYASQDSAGNLNIFGNMYLPGTRTKFKKVASEIAKKEKNYDMLKTKGSQYVQESNPANKFERLKFNSGNVMMQGGELGQKDLAQKKEQLSALQKAMLDTAAEFGIDAEKMSAGRVAKARKGKQMKKKGYYQAGGPVNDPTMSDRNNNPGNIKWSKFARQMGAKKGPPAVDGGNFAVFPTREKGVQAMDKLLTSKSYKNLDVDSAISKWTGGHPYNYSLSSLRGKKVGELTPQERQEMMSTMITGEGTRYGPGAKPPATPGAPPPTFTPYGLPAVPGFTPDPQRPRPGAVQPPFDPLNPPPDPGPIPSNVEPLHFNQIMGEIFAAATNNVEPVPAQRYEPQLYQPYQVSFQDRLNQNQNSFNALRRAVGPANPSALGELAAQKYSADTMVKGDEFRTNQAIASDVTNKNVSLLNDAELKNLGIADTQMVRQSTARSKTRQMDQMIVNSLASKFEQNKFENKRLAAYENLYDYRFVPQDDGGLKATYYGPNAMFNFSGHNDRGQNPDVKTISRYDAQGNLKGYSEFDDYDLREQQRALDLEIKRRNLPLLQAPKLNK